MCTVHTFISDYLISIIRFEQKMWIYLTLGVILLFTYWWRKIASAPCDNFPPGPIGLPILGYLPIATEKNILVALDKIHDTYGKIVSVNLGPSKRTVVIGDYDILREAFKDGKLNSRPLELQWGNEYWRYGDGTDSRGLIFTVVKSWKIIWVSKSENLLNLYRVKNGLNNDDLHYAVSGTLALVNPPWRT